MSSFIHLTIFQQDVNFIWVHILGDMSNFIPLTSFYEELKISILMKPFFLEICPVVFFLQVVFKKPILIEPFLWGYVQFHLHICQFWSSLNCSQSLFYFVPQEKEFHSQTFIHLTSQPLPSLHFNGRFNFYISYVHIWYIHLISWNSKLFCFLRTTHSSTILVNVWNCSFYCVAHGVVMQHIAFQSFSSYKMESYPYCICTSIK